MSDYDFRRVAFEGRKDAIIETATLLRKLVDKLLDRLFKQSEKDKQPPDLTEILSVEEMGNITDLHLWHTKNIALTRPMEDNSMKGQPISLKDIIDTAMKEKIEPGRWQLTFQQRIIKALNGGTENNGLPEALFPVLEKTAWTDLYFKHALFFKVQRFLKERVLFYPEVPCIPDFSACGFWGLIGLCRVEGPKNGKETNRLYLEFIRKARYLTLKEHSAGFWDQWLLRTAYTQWTEAFSDDEDLFIGSILALPLFPKQKKETQEIIKKKKKKSLFKRLFKWIGSLFSRKHKMEITIKGIKKGQHVVLSSPHWEAQVPVFLKATLNHPIPTEP